MWVYNIYIYIHIYIIVCVCVYSCCTASMAVHAWCRGGRWQLHELPSHGQELDASGQRQGRKLPGNRASREERESGHGQDGAAECERNRVAASCSVFCCENRGGRRRGWTGKKEGENEGKLRKISLISSLKKFHLTRIGSSSDHV